MENQTTLTAVEWLENELKKIPLIKPEDAFKQAKQMEKEQLADSKSTTRMYTEEEVKRAIAAALAYFPDRGGNSEGYENMLNRIINALG